LALEHHKQWESKYVWIGSPQCPDRRPCYAALPLRREAAEAAGKPRKMSAAQQIDMLVSRAEIEEVLLDYARGNDHADEELIRSCFWPESTHKHGGFDGTSTKFVDFAMKILPKLKYCKHHISNVSIRVKGDKAFSECYYAAHHQRDVKDGTGEEDIFFEGRYIDLLERRGGVWKIIRRRGMSDWTSAPKPAIPYASLPAGHPCAAQPG
jgi:hypothetical protein